jgi:hypothetical protein
MFTRILSTGIGPHADLDLAISPTGRTVIRGHSEHGKRVLIDAILLVLHGVTRGGEPFDSAQMSADRVAIIITSASGREYGYTRKTSPKWTYAYQGETMAQTSAKGWIDALSMARLPLWTGGPVRRDALALCVEPMAWTRYAVSAPAESRKLCDMFVSTAGATADEAAKELYLAAGYTWTNEPLTEKAAALVVTEARRAMGEGAAKLEQARAALAAVEAPVEPDTTAADALPEMTAALAEWERYDTAAATHHRAVTAAADALARHEQRVTDWRTTCQRLGEHDADAMLRADAAHRAALAAWDEESTTRVQRHAAEVERAGAEYRAAVDTRAERMAARESEAKAKYGADLWAADEDHQRDLRDYAGRCHELRERHDESVMRHVGLQSREAADRLALAEWEARRTEQAATCDTCGQSLPCADLGPAPVVRVAGSPPVAPTMPPEPVRRMVPSYVAPAPEREVVARTVAPLGPKRAAPVYVAPTPSPRPPEPVWTEPAPLVEPTPPTVARPDPEALHVARAAAQARRLHAAAVEQHARTVARLKGAEGDAVNALARLLAVAQKASAWLDAVRAAPGVVTRGLAWLGAIGDGITVEMPTEGPAVVVKIDGRPWRLASRGRLVCADAHLRRAFTVALGVPTLPIIVDDRQSWTGALDVAGPVIELVTDPAAERITSTV